MIALEVADLVLIASRTLGLDTGQVLDLLDPAAAEHALAQARPGSEPADPATCAAMLLHALVRERPLRRGNQQVALAATLQFLALNDQDMATDPPGPVAAIVTRLAAGTLDAKDAADWLAPRLRPSGRAATQVKEAPMRPRPALPLAERIKQATMRTRPKGRFAVHRPGQTGPRPGAGRGQGTRPRFRRTRASPARPARRGRRRRRPCAGVAGHLAGGNAGPGRGDRRPWPGSAPCPHPVHAAGQAGAGAVAARGAAPRAPVRRHRAPSAEPGRGGDGIAAQLLAGQGAGYDLVKERVVAMLTGRYEQSDPKTRLVRLPVPAGLADVTEQLRQVQRQKTAAFAAGDLDSSAALRAREKQLRAEKLRLEAEWAAGTDVQAVIAENQRVHRELDRLRALLRQHGIEPDGGTAQTA